MRIVLMRVLLVALSGKSCQPDLPLNLISYVHWRWTERPINAF